MRWFWVFPVLCRVHVQDVACLVLFYGLHCHSLSVMSELSADSEINAVGWWILLIWGGGLYHLTRFVWHLLWCPIRAHIIHFDVWDDSFSSQTCAVMCFGDAGKSARLITAHHTMTKGTGSSCLNRIRGAGGVWAVCVCESFFAVAALGHK